MCVVAGMCLRQDDLPDLRRERNRSLSRQWPELVSAVILNMGVEDRNNQRLKTSNAVFSSFRRRRFIKSSRASGTATFHASSIVISRGALCRTRPRSTGSYGFLVFRHAEMRPLPVVVANAFLWIAAQRNSVDDRSRSGSGKQAIYLQRPRTRVG
jgi:hypothetical protein